MAEKKSVISQLQTVGEEALGKLASKDVARSALQGATKLKERAEKTLTGFDEVEKRLDAIEKRLSALEGKKSSSASSSSSTGSKAASTKASSAKPKSSASS